MCTTNEDCIYIVVSKTNTILGKLIQRKLKVGYNHCSLSLDRSLENIYSFGRKELRNVFSAGFVEESKSSGFFKEYKDSVIAVIRVPVSHEEKERIAEIIGEFQARKTNFKYSLLGLIYCYLGIPRQRKDKFFCSQFVAQVLGQAGLSLFGKPETLVRPHDFLDIQPGELIYTGRIGHYCFS